MNKVYDYMMAGKPIINGVKASNDDVAKAGCGITIEPESPEAIIEAVNKLKSMDSADREKMGLNGKKWVLENADYTILADNFLTKLDEIGPSVHGGGGRCSLEKE